jgi:hypothetical protein
VRYNASRFLLTSVLFTVSIRFLCSLSLIDNFVNGLAEDTFLFEGIKALLRLLEFEEVCQLPSLGLVENLGAFLRV